MPSASVLDAARLLAGGAATLAGAVLADSAMEHYRGSFDNRAMPAPVVVSALSTMADGALALGYQPAGTSAQLIAGLHAAGAATGAAGLGFHIYNITRQVGGIRWGTLFYQAPIGAPAALILAGTLGAAAQALASGSTRLGPVPLLSGRALAGFTAVGIAGTSGEAALLHFRGAYHNPAMYLPVLLPPVAAVLLGRAGLAGRASSITTAALAITAALGLVGSAFHAYGVSRNMGGFRNWRQNLLAGPPLPAPPSFTGLAIAGLGALILMRSTRSG